jgi:DNA-binding HxlR family transcriptional regulator
MTTKKEDKPTEGCPIEGLLKMLSGRWKPQIFRLAVSNSIRFNTLLRQIPESNKQSIATALRELEEADLLVKTIIQLKPLHIEYHLSEKGRSVIPIFQQLEGLV